MQQKGFEDSSRRVDFYEWGSQIISEIDSVRCPGACHVVFLGFEMGMGGEGEVMILGVCTSIGML